MLTVSNAMALITQRVRELQSLQDKWVFSRELLTYAWALRGPYGDSGGNPVSLALECIFPGSEISDCGFMVTVWGRGSRPVGCKVGVSRQLAAATLEFMACRALEARDPGRPSHREALFTRLMALDLRSHLRFSDGIESGSAASLQWGLGIGCFDGC